MMSLSMRCSHHSSRDRTQLCRRMHRRHCTLLEALLSTRSATIGMPHRNTWKYYQNTCKAHVQPLEDLKLGHLNLGDSCPQGAIPVDQAVVTVDEPIPVQPDECLLDGCTPGGIHGEHQPVPVHAAADAPQLIADAVAFGFLPLEHLLQELGPACARTRSQGKAWHCLPPLQE